jgi:hypothetical protein
MVELALAFYSNTIGADGLQQFFVTAQAGSETKGGQ